MNSRLTGAGKFLQKFGHLRGLLALVLVFFLGVFFTPENFTTGRSVFLTWNTQTDILFEYAEYGILACGMTLVILTGGIDLSVGSVLGLSATFFSLLLIGHGLHPAICIPLTLLVGALAGFINGFLSARFGVQPFVATLAMMAAARGLAKIVSDGIKVQPGAKDWYVYQNAAPPIFGWMTTPLPIIGLQPATVVFLICVILFAVIVRYTTFGRSLFAIGGSQESARLSGINVARSRILAFVLCGFLAALAGIINASRIEIGDPESGFTYELDAIAAVVIGGTSLAGGKGGLGLTLIGVLVIAYINKILSINNVEESYRLVAQGIIIIAAVLIQKQKSVR